MYFCLTNQYIKKCVLIRHTFCENLMKIFVTKHKCRSFLWLFQTGQCCWPAKITALEIRNLSKTDRIPKLPTVFFLFSLSRAYIWSILGLEPFFPSIAKVVGTLNSTPKRPKIQIFIFSIRCENACYWIFKWLKSIRIKWKNMIAELQYDYAIDIWKREYCEWISIKFNSLLIVGKLINVH